MHLPSRTGTAAECRIRCIAELSKNRFGTWERPMPIAHLMCQATDGKQAVSDPVVEEPQGGSFAYGGTIHSAVSRSWQFFLTVVAPSGNNARRKERTLPEHDSTLGARQCGGQAAPGNSGPEGRRHRSLALVRSSDRVRAQGRPGGK
jgi:hypothetical protein